MLQMLQMYYNGCMLVSVIHVQAAFYEAFVVVAVVS